MLGIMVGVNPVYHTDILWQCPIAKAYGCPRVGPRLANAKHSAAANTCPLAILSPRAQALALCGTTYWKIASRPPCRQTPLRKLL
jgi:hypothetical protein